MFIDIYKVKDMFCRNYISANYIYIYETYSGQFLI